MKQTAYKSLFRQFINRLIPPMVLTVALAMTANIVVGHNMARMEQSRRLQFLGASYAEALIKPLWDCDDTAAQAIMNSMLQSRAISGGRLHNAAQAVLWPVECFRTGACHPMSSNLSTTTVQGTASMSERLK